MSKVDVLTWIANTPADNGHKAAERDAVRAAIAELIEAAKERQKTRGKSISDGIDDYERLNSALAKVQP